MTLIWTTTMAPFSSLAHAWLDSLNMFQGEISRSPQNRRSELWHTEKHTQIHMCCLICHTCCRDSYVLGGSVAGTRLI